VNFNKKIIESPIVFLLGAGSSAPLGMPTTIGFREVAKRRASPSYRSKIQDLYEMAAVRYLIGTEQVSVEDLLEFIHELRLALWIMWRSGIKPSVSETLSALDLNDWQNASVSINKIRYQIIKIIHRVYGDCSVRKVSSLWSPLLTEVSQYTKVLPIFTMNYDWTFEKLAIGSPAKYKVVDGYSSVTGGSWDDRHFSQFRPSSNKVNIALFKLHGSTCWLRTGVKSLGTFTESEEMRGDIRDNYQSPFEIIYPGHRREVELGDEHWWMEGLGSNISGGQIETPPYSLMYEYLRASLSKAKALIVIGYAFGDPEVNNIVGKAMESNSQLHLIDVDPGRGIFSNPPYEFKLDHYSNASIDDRERYVWTKAKFGTAKTKTRIIEKIEDLLE